MKLPISLLVKVAGIAVAGTFSVSAMATPLPFVINPNAINSALGLANFTATDIQGSSYALVQQTAPGVQHEQGYIQVTGFQNSTSVLNSYTTGLLAGDATNQPTNNYGLYVTFSSTVHGLNGFGGGTGSIGAGDFTFTLWADPSAGDGDNTYTPGVTNAGNGVAPVVTDGSNDDFVLAYGSSLFGNAGITAATGAPFLSVKATFNVCDGVTTDGGCGAFDASTFFVNPVPFYDFSLTSTISGSSDNLDVTAGAAMPNATLNGIVSDTNFSKVPEPGVLGLLGLGLVAVGGLGWRKKARPASA